MKETEVKKPVATADVRHPQPKQTSGDKAFDEAIDKMIKKPFYATPAK